eukprot:UN10140
MKSNINHLFIRHPDDLLNKIPNQCVLQQLIRNAYKRQQNSLSSLSYENNNNNNNNNPSVSVPTNTNNKTLVFVCGPAGMVKTAEAVAYDLNIDFHAEV